MTEIKWTDLPPSRASSKGQPSPLPITGKHAEIADALRRHPGDWALVLPSVAISMVTAINKASLRAYAPAGTFEAVGRNHDYAARRCDVYARFVGEVSA